MENLNNQAVVLTVKLGKTVTQSPHTHSIAEEKKERRKVINLKCNFRDEKEI